MNQNTELIPRLSQNPSRGCIFSTRMFLRFSITILSPFDLFLSPFSLFSPLSYASSLRFEGRNQIRSHPKSPFCSAFVPNRTLIAVPIVVPIMIRMVVRIRDPRSRLISLANSQSDPLDALPTTKDGIAAFSPKMAKKSRFPAVKT